MTKAGTSQYAPWYAIAWRLLWVVPFYVLFLASCVAHTFMYWKRSNLFDEL